MNSTNSRCKLFIKYYIFVLKLRDNYESRKIGKFIAECRKKQALTQEQLTEKLKYYESSVGLQKEIDYLEDCFHESMLCTKEDYLFWIDSLKQELKEIRHWIPKNYTYEEEQAKRLLSK